MINATEYLAMAALHGGDYRGMRLVYVAIPVQYGFAYVSSYVAFAATVDGARTDRQRAERALKDGPLTPAEAELLLAKAARKGSPNTRTGIREIGREQPPKGRPPARSCTSAGPPSARQQTVRRHSAQRSRPRSRPA